MKKWLNYLPTIFIITIVMSLIFYSSQGTTEQMNYSRFKDVAEHAEFEDSTLTISTTIIQVEGSYKKKAKMLFLDLGSLYQIQRRTLSG